MRASRPCRTCPPPSDVIRRRATNRLRDAAIAHLLRSGVTQREITRLSNRSVASVTGDVRLRIIVSRQSGTSSRSEFLTLDLDATRALILHLEQTRAFGDRTVAPLFTTGTRRPIDKREVGRIARWANKGDLR